MKARVGDHLIVGGRRDGEPRRRAEIVAVLGRGGTPPFRVRWPEDGHESLLMPLPEMVVEPRAEAQAAPAPAGWPDDPELRLVRLEESAEAIGWQLERLREDVRALAAAIRP
jgi:hypothetical protein